MPEKFYTEDEVVQRLLTSQGALSQKEFAEKIGVSAQLLSVVFKRGRAPGEKILDFLELEAGGRMYKKKGKP